MGACVECGAPECLHGRCEFCKGGGPEFVVAPVAAFGPDLAVTHWPPVGTSVELHLPDGQYWNGTVKSVGPEGHLVELDRREPW